MDNLQISTPEGSRGSQISTLIIEVAGIGKGVGVVYRAWIRRHI